MTFMLQQSLARSVKERKSKKVVLGLNQQNELRYMRRVKFFLLLLPHLALPLLVPSEELPDLIQEAGALLPPAQPEGGLCGAARGCHGCGNRLAVSMYL